MSYVVRVLLLTLMFSFFNHMKVKGQNKQIEILALGDSYTIGERVDEMSSWPVQLCDRLNSRGLNCAKPTVIAKTGWTSDELLSALTTANIPNVKFDLVSILIGVNNQYRGYHTEIFKNELAELIFKAIGFAGNNKERVIVLSIPDYSVTAFAKEKNTQKIANQISQYNSVAKEVAGEFGIKFYDITQISKLAMNDPSLIADDDLHPSSAMYKLWVEKIEPDVLEILK